MKNCRFVIILLLYFALFGCEKQKESHPPKSLEDIYSWYQNNNWAAESLYDSLVGEWRWLYTQNFWAPEAAHYTTNQETFISFRADSVLYVIAKEDTLHTTKWQVMLKGNEMYELALEEPHQYLHGRIFICEDLLLLNNSYVDGVDNFFERARISN
jgi:hypothetical protein